MPWAAEREEQDRAAQHGGEGRPCLELEKGVLPRGDPGCAEHEAQGIGDEEASLWGQDGRSLSAFPQGGRDRAEGPCFAIHTAGSL